MTTIIRTGCLAAGLILMAGPVAAQDFGLLQSAETIEQGNLKLAGGFVNARGEDGADDDTAFTVRGGYGFTDRIDGEIKYSSFDEVDALGVDFEYWAVRNAPLDLSLGAGYTSLSADNGSDASSLDLTAILTGQATPALELGVGVDVGFVELDDVPPGADDSFESVHLVPMLEFALSDVVDLVGEYGVALNDESNDYLAGAIAFYFK